jgi:hypothetical protein
MGAGTHFAFLLAVWLLWAVGGVLALHADKLHGKRPTDAGFSPMPIVPFFPLAALGVAELLNAIRASWGTWIVGGTHAVLAVAFLACIVRECLRIRWAKLPPA